MATIIVDTLNDVVNAGDGLTSLREAVAAANANDTIIFDNGLSGTLTLTQGELVLTQNISIDGDTNGDNVADITISGDADTSGTATTGDSRIFNVQGFTPDDLANLGIGDVGRPTTVNLSSLSLVGGFADGTLGDYTGDGGAVFVEGYAVLNVQDSTFVGNTATVGGYGNYTGGRGGAIFASYLSSINLARTTFSGNYAENFGGGLYVQGDANILQSTFAGNSAASFGGAISTSPGADLTLTNTTITQNTSDSGGGIDLFYATLTANNTVVAGNYSYGGDDVYSFNGQLTAQNSFFGTNVTIDVDNGYNTNNGGSPGFLGPSYSGTVPTVAIDDSSPLYNAGAWSLLPETSQSANGGAISASLSTDIGAHEAQTLVTTLSDEAFNGGDLAAETADGNGLSLREAIGLANAGSLSTPISFDASLAGGVITLVNGQMDIGNAVTPVELFIDGDINNDGQFDISIDAGGASRIFEITNGGIAAINGLMLSGGYANDGNGGGAIRVDGSELILFNSVLVGNSALTGGGGALEVHNSIYNPANFLPVGTLLTNVTMVGNTSYSTAAGTGGGAIGAYNSDLALVNSTIVDNQAANYAGGVGMIGGPTTGQLFVLNSTVTNNQSYFTGGYGAGGVGGIDAFIGIVNSVVAENYSSPIGGGAATVADDAGQYGGNLYAAASFFSSTVGITLDGGYNQNGAGDPLLGFMAFNGAGGVPTRAPLNTSLITSPLIDSGSTVPSGAFVPDLLDGDGDLDISEFLPIDGNFGPRIVGADIDIGAVETTLNDVIRGLDVVLAINPLDETLVGGLGDDILEGGSGADTLDGGDGNDTASYESSDIGVTVTIGGAISGGDATGDTFISIENLIGSAHVDSLKGDGNDNVLEGGAGGDTLHGSSGSDTASYENASAGVIASLYNPSENMGDAAGDTYLSIENLRGSSFNDVLTGNGLDNTIDGGAGRDTLDVSHVASPVEIRLNAGTATGAGIGSDILISIENVVGGQGDDLIFGNNEFNIIDGQGGDDVIFALGDDDFVFGGDGNDTLNGNLNDDNLFGGAGDDSVLGAQGNDTLEGGDGNDIVSGGSGDDNLDGGAGDDDVLGGADNDFMLGGSGEDTLSGGGGNDFLDGGDDDDVVLGAAGTDNAFGGSGNDIVSGGTGNDFVFGDDGDDSVIGADGDDFEVNGGAGNDVVSGGNGNDSVLGGSGDDNVLGAAGNDRVDGGTGTDTITGGDGADTLVFHLGYGNDTAPGFENDLDTLELDDALWGGGLTAQQVVDMFAVQTSPGIVDFDFGGGDTLRVVNGNGIAKNDLVDDIVIV